MDTMACGNCGWAGTSSEITQGACPGCHEGAGLGLITLPPHRRVVIVGVDDNDDWETFWAPRRHSLRLRCNAVECLYNGTRRMLNLMGIDYHDVPRCSANAAELHPNSPKCPKYIKARGVKYVQQFGRIKRPTQNGDPTI